MSNYGKLDELLGEYWNAAYKEGLDGRYHDTVDSKAQRTLNSIHEELEKQLAERDAALARCVGALEAAELEIFQLSGEDIENEIINQVIRPTVASLPTSAQATAKVLAAARRLVERGFAYTSDFRDLEEAIREEQEGK